MEGEKQITDGYKSLRGYSLFCIPLCGNVLPLMNITEDLEMW